MDMKTIVLLAILIAATAFLGWALYALVWKLIIVPTYLKLSGPAYYYKKTARKLGISMSDVKKQFRKVVQEEIDRCSTLNTKIKIVPYHDVYARDELGMGIWAKFGVVLCTANWIELALTQNQQWRLALTQSVGHEIGHKEDIQKGILFSFRKKTDQKFFYWLREIRCDYKGVWYAMKFTDMSREKVIKAIRAKARKYNKHNDGKTFFKHPEWNFRIKMLNKYPELTEAAIREIAAKAGCKNEKYIQEIIKKTLH